MQHDDELTERLEALLLVPDPVTLAASLYGVTWRGESLRESEHGWSTRRLPHAHRAASLLEEALAGLVAHDGRSTRAGRGSGWWVFDPASGSWLESDVEAVAAALLPGLDAVTASALAEVEEERAALGDRFSWESEALRLARLRVALLGALSALVAAGRSRGFGEVATALRSRLRLADEDLAAIVTEWLRESVEVEGWEPGERLSPPELRDVYAEHGLDALPPHLLRRGLTLALGRLEKSNGSRFWRLPVWLFDEDDDEDTTEVAV